MVKSPFSNKNATLIHKIPTSIIIEQYKKSFAIDVSSYFQYIDNLCLYRCEDTDYKYYYPFSTAGDEYFYNFFQKKYDWYYQTNKWEYHKILNNINFEYKKVLEIGCGHGYFLDKIQFKKGSEIEGIEFNSEAVEYCKNKKLKVFQKDITTSDKSNYYDIICAFQVLEHIADVGVFLQHCVKLLSKGGQLIFAVPNNDSILFSNQDSLNFVNQKNQENCLLNLPPHHMGRWRLKTFKNLEHFYPLKLTKTYFEPIWNDRKHYLTLLGKKDNLIEKIKFKLLQPYIKGHSILVIFEKTI